ncbi:MAG: FtsQ-type POTRA domain-containing protein [Cyanobacteriota bacterium]|nr:FtsQ-type POTRA domain-containing protein [Cyanobacteriota bacterium]
MTSIASVSPSDLKARRQKLKRRRQLAFLQGLWRSFLVSGLAGGLLWASAQPNWVIRQPEQIEVEGNTLLSPIAIRALLPLSYPQSLWRVQPQVLSRQMQSRAPIAEATVTRKLLPPSLTVEVRERQPIARVLDESRQTVGFLDAQGNFLPESSYQSLLPDAPLPDLQAIAIDAQYRSHWSEIYAAIRDSSVQIYAIDFQTPSNPILKTELGIVHLGQYEPHTPRLRQQLKVLAQMRELPERIHGDRLAYIDLTHPERPTVQLHLQARSSRP